MTFLLQSKCLSRQLHSIPLRYQNSEYILHQRITQPLFTIFIIKKIYTVPYSYPPKHNRLVAKSLFIFSLALISTHCFAQAETASVDINVPIKLGEPDSVILTTLQNVVVTGTRREQQFATATLPTLLVTRTQLQATGALRLSDVLNEQTGLTLTTMRSTGVQMQGLNPDYTLILIDGEPMIGRTAGAIELSRIAVGNIQQIEIVKGASSSLYGSDALAGVVNIITKKPKNGEQSGMVGLRYGTNNTIDANADIQVKKGKWNATLFSNYFKTDGYDLAGEAFGKTVAPYYNYMFQTRVGYDFSDRTKLSVALRYFREAQENAFDIGTPQKPEFVTGNGKLHDANLNVIASHFITDKWKATLRLYGADYYIDNQLVYQKNSELYQSDIFNQRFMRPELISEYSFDTKNALTLGAGHSQESVNSTRYTEAKYFNNTYAFVQHEWQPVKAFTLIAGGRLDVHSAYATQFSPKISARYDVNKVLAIRASTGVGFKSPDFRQLYLSFNNAVAGYSVFGSQELASNVAVLQTENQIAELLVGPTSFGKLEAERSRAYNFGIQLKPNKAILGTINAFRNDIDNLIETQIVARKTNGQAVYSYRNINKVFTQGVDMDWQWQMNNLFSLSAGYQYLEAKDKEVLSKLAAGEVYRRDPVTYDTKRVTVAEYGGLFNRSAHSANMKLYFESKNKDWSATVRTIYKGRFGFADRNANVILDADNEYVKGYFVTNMSVSKTFKQKYTVQLGCDNVLNYTDALYIPTMPGRLVWAKVNFSFGRK